MAMTMRNHRRAPSATAGSDSRRRYAVALAEPAEGDEQKREQIDEPEQLEEDAPAPGSALLVERGQRYALQRGVLPTGLSGGVWT